MRGRRPRTRDAGQRWPSHGPRRVAWIRPTMPMPMPPCARYAAAAGIRAVPSSAGMGFDGYFLIVADFIQWAKSQSIPVGPGRGSGAGSVVAWALTITDLDPLRFNLLFERFLNPERISMPDFDIDFLPGPAATEVIRLRAPGIRRRPGGADHHLREAAGARCHSRCWTRAGAAVRPGQQASCELIPNNPGKAPVTLQQAIDGEPRLQSDAATTTRRWRRLMEIALAAGGAVSTCQHPCRGRCDRRPAADRSWYRYTAIRNPISW